MTLYTNGRHGRSLDETRSLISGLRGDGDGPATIEMDTLPTQWLQIRKDVVVALSEVEKQMESLDREHQQHLLPGFEDDGLREKERKRIETLTRRVATNFSACQRTIKKIAALAETPTASGPLSRSESTLAHNMAVALTSKFSRVNNRFRKQQALYLQSKCSKSAFDAVLKPNSI